MNNNYERMQEFLDMLKEFAISNPNEELNKKFVYSNLIKLGVKNDENYYFYSNIVQQNFYESWKQRYKETNNLKVADDLQGNFCWFYNTCDVGNAIKLYIPMEYGYIREGANRLFDFISSTGMQHQSKIASKIRNDNVVVRVRSLEDVEKIVEYVSSNSYIKQGMLSVNPFLPNINGIGITMDNHFSFNSELSNVLSSFIEWLKKENRLDLVTVEELNKFINFQIKYIGDPDLKDIYVLLSKTTSKDFKLSDFIDHAKNKLIDDYDEEKRITDPGYYLEKAIVITEKYYPGNSRLGISEYLKGVANKFTRKDNARFGLMKYVSPQDVISLMTKKLYDSGITYVSNQEELIDKYLNLVLNNQKQLNNDNQNNYSNEFEIIKNAYINTLNVYDSYQANEAFRRLYTNSKPECFTNKLGDRDKLKKLIASYEVKEIILSNINLDGIDVNNENDILTEFISCLDLENNKKAL